MASTPKQSNGESTNNNTSESIGKRKKTRSSKASYLSKWLDKTMTMQNGTPTDYDQLPNTNWPNPSQFAPGYDPCRFMYGCTPEPMSLPNMPTYYSPVPPYYNPEYHRYMQNRSFVKPRQRRFHKAEEVTTTPASATPNSMNYLQPKSFTDSQDYTSLPPIVTSVADTNSNSDLMNDKENDNRNTNRRYSDPELPDVAKNGDIESESDSGSDLSGSQVGSRLLTCLIDQITTLKTANDRLNKELRDTRAELDNFRQHNTYLKPCSPHIGVTPNRTLNTNGLVNGQYSPGFLADLVREIRDAARVREEAMFARVRSMMLDRNESSLPSSEAKFTEKYLEEIKSSLRTSEADKRCMMDRIAKLEEELKTLRTNGVEQPEVRIPNGTEDADTARLRKELADTRKAKLSADEHALKLERLVTQLRSKFNGLALTNGPESLPSEPEHESRTRRDELDTSRIRRTSVNSSTASTVVFGPVTDL